MSFTEKTVKNIRTGDKPKQTSKLVKAKRKTKWFKDEKAEVVEDDKKSIEKGIPTTRKVSKVRDDYQILYKKTEKIMQEYR